MSPVSDVVLFDPFQTLGSEVASDDERFVDFEVYPSAHELVHALAARARLGVLVLDPEVQRDRVLETLEAGGLVPPIDPDLVRVVEEGDEVQPFRRLRMESGLAEQNVVFVSQDAHWRARARDAGLQVAPHAALADAVLNGESLHFARLFARGAALREEPAWEPLTRRLPIVPLLESREPEPDLYAIVSQRALQALSQAPLADALGFEELPGSPDAVARTMLVLLHVTKEQVESNPELQHFVSTLPETGFQPRHTPRGLLIAYPGDQDIEALHPPPEWSGHGHTRALVPSLSFVKAPKVKRIRLANRRLSDEERGEIAKLDADAFRSQLESCVG